jgi:hypothetical protein
LNEKSNLEVFNVAKKKLSIFKDEVGYNLIRKRKINNMGRNKGENTRTVSLNPHYNIFPFNHAYLVFLNLSSA